MTPAQPMISACIIARNEAALLPRCIETLNGLCDEIRVLDTGSGDNTIAVAHSLGAVVASDTTCNDADGLISDFSRARNECLRLARGKWVLQIDADEMLLSGHDILRDVVLRDQSDVLGITLRNGSSSWMGTRFFRAQAARAYVGRVHELLEYQGHFLAARDVVIENRPDKTGKEPSSSRNLRLLRIETTDDPQAARAWFYLGNEERRVKNYEAAISSYRKCIELGTHYWSRFHAAYYLAGCLFIQKDYIGALETVDNAIDIDPRYGEGHCLRGDILLMIGAHAAAILSYEHALNCGGPPADAVFAVSPACYDQYPKAQIIKLTVKPNIERGDADVRTS